MDELLKTLKEWSKKIRDQKEIGGNTHDLVGNLFLRYADFAEKLDDKIDNLETYKKGYFSNFQLLNDTYPNPQKGWYAYVNEHDETSGTDTVFVWEVVSESGEWLWSKTEIEITEDLLTLHEYALKSDLDSVDQRLSNDLEQTKTSLTEGLTKKADGCKLTEDNKLQLTSEGKNVGEAIELPSGIINLSKDGKEYKDKTEAREAVNKKERLPGQVITYKTTADSWVLDHFKGAAAAYWSNNEEWDQYAPTKQITLILNSLDNIKGDITILNEEVKNKIDGAYTDKVDEETFLYFTSNGEPVGEPIILPAGGGSGGDGGDGVTMRLRTIGSTTIVAGKDSDAYIRWNFTSVYQSDGTETGSGTMSISVNNVIVFNGEVQQGDGSFNLKNYITSGRSSVRLRITDGTKNTRSVSYVIQLSSLTLESTFNTATIHNTNPLPFRYTVVGEGTKTIQFWLNGVELTPDTINTSNVQITKEIPVSKEGVNTLLVKATTAIEGVQLNSNDLFFEFIYAKESLKEFAIISTFNKTSVKQFETLTIPYFAYDPSNDKAKVSIYVDDTLIETTEVTRTLQAFEYRVAQADQIKIELRCGTASKTFNLSVEKSEIGIEEVLADLQFKAKASGKSNTSSNKDSWEYGDYRTTFEGFNWVENGWLKDSENNTALKLTGDAKASINIRPFSSSVLTDGMSYTIEYSTEDVADENAIIMEQFIDGVGVKITPTSISINSVETGLVSYLDSSKKVSITFAVERKTKHRLLKIYINGILSQVVQYSDSDRFNQSATDLKISTAERKAVVYVYNIRWYKNELEDFQILNNYIYDTEESKTQETIYKKNDIIDAYGNIDYTKAVNFIPCMNIIGKLPTSKKDPQINTITFENLQRNNTSFTAEEVTNNVQGTSSQYYPRKNFKFKFNKEKGATLTDTGEEIKNYALDDSTLPANVFCVKADFAESSGTHNTGLAIIVNDILTDAGIKIPEQDVNDKVRTTIFGYPILIFHKETVTSEPKFIGKYNFNYDKAAEHVFGFADGCESWEFKDNTSEMCLFQSADFESTYTNNKGEVLPTWTNHLEARYPDGSMDTTKVRKVFEWVISCKNNPAKFKQEVSSIFDIDNLLSYWIITEHYAAVDQRAKNQFLTLYKDGKWRFIFYDNDTILGVDNIGTIKFRYDVESQDKIDDGHVWNGWDSELWLLVKDAFWAELVAMYQKLRAGKMTYEHSMEIFEDHQASQWAERIYNKDGYYKYIEPLINGDKDKEGKFTNYLAELQGSRATHRRWWMSNRFKYMDSRFKTGSYMNDFVSLRLYTPDTYETVAPNADFTLVTNKPGYSHIKFGQTESAQVRTTPKVSFTIKAPTGMKMNDTETIIYGASSLKDLGDLAPKYVGLVDVASATRLERLIIGKAEKYTNLNFKNLTLGNNNLLREINVANCPNFGNIEAGSTSASLDLRKLLVLEKVNASNTALKSLSLPETGTVQEVTFPASITSLVLKNQTGLTSPNLVIEGHSNIQTLVVENSPEIDGYELAKKIISTNYNNPPLKAIRLTNVIINDSDEAYIMKLATMDGIDEDGNLKDNSPYISGSAYFTTMTQYSFDFIKSKFGDHLSIEVGRKVDRINFQNSDVENIALATYDTTNKGYLTSNDVETKTWTPSLTSIPEPFTFDEINYWKGGTANIANVPFITSAGIYTNAIVSNAKYNNCPTLTRLVIEDDGELLASKPKLEMGNTWLSCPNISSIQIYGSKNRYSLSKGNMTLLGKRWISPDLSIDMYINSLQANIKNTMIIESSNELPLYYSKDDQLSYTFWNAALPSSSIVMNNIYLIDLNAWLNRTISFFTINGVCRNTSLTPNNSIYPRFICDGYQGGLNVLTINAEEEEDKSLCYIEFYRPRINQAHINAKCTPDDPHSILKFGYTTEGRSLGTVVLGEKYMPSIIQRDGSKDLNTTLVIKASSYNGQPYIPTCNISAVSTNIKFLYVPDERLLDYKNDSAWSACTTEILPLSTSPFN